MDESQQEMLLESHSTKWASIRKRNRKILVKQRHQKVIDHQILMLHHDALGIEMGLLVWPFPARKYIDLGKSALFYFAEIPLLFLQQKKHLC